MTSTDTEHENTWPTTIRQNQYRAAKYSKVLAERKRPIHRLRAYPSGFMKRRCTAATTAPSPAPARTSSTTCWRMATVE